LERSRKITDLKKISRLDFEFDPGMLGIWTAVCRTWYGKLQLPGPPRITHPSEKFELYDMQIFKIITRPTGLFCCEVNAYSKEDDGTYSKEWELYS